MSNNLSILVSKVATDSRERFIVGQNNKEVAKVVPSPINFNAAKQQGHRWPNTDCLDRGHVATLSSLISFKTGESAAVIALHVVIPDVYELDPRDMLYFHMPLAYIEH